MYYIIVQYLLCKNTKHYIFSDLTNQYLLCNQNGLVLKYRAEGATVS